MLLTAVLLTYTCFVLDRFVRLLPCSRFSNFQLPGLRLWLSLPRAQAHPDRPYGCKLAWASTTRKHASRQSKSILRSSGSADSTFLCDSPVLMVLSFFNYFCLVLDFCPVDGYLASYNPTCSYSTFDFSACCKLRATS